MILARCKKGKVQILKDSIISHQIDQTKKLELISESEIFLLTYQLWHPAD